MINDLDLKNWKKYLGDLTTDSLWITSLSKKNGIFVIPKRDIFRDIESKFKNFHGVFIPEIPYQFIKRFTKKGDVVWDCFGGIGTTYYVAQLLDRKCIINDINPQAEFINRADARDFNPGCDVDLIFMHPPYFNIIKFSDLSEDGSNTKSLDDFLNWFEDVVKNVVKYHKSGKYLVLVCGNIYYKGEELTLGVWCKDIIRKYNYQLKSHIVKDYGETKSNRVRSYNLRYYRQLKFGFNNFYGDNIFLLRRNNGK